jgi:hypothetical protein
LQTEQNALHVVHRTPLVLQDVQTNPTRKVDIRVVNGGLEEHCWWSIRIIIGECKGEFEGQVLVRRLCRSVDRRCPREQVAIGVGKGGDSGRRGDHKLHQF